VNGKNIVIFLILVMAMGISFLIGGYPALTPLYFIAGLIVAVLVGIVAAAKTDTKFLVLFLVFAILVAAMDEYAHTAAGTLVYYDQGIPSLLTVLGWGIIMLGILFIAYLVTRVPAVAVFKASPEHHRITRILPAVISSGLVAAMVWVQGYASLFTPLLVLVYVFLILGSCYYTYHQPLVWNLALFAVSVIVGGVLEWSGALEGLWSFHFQEPVSLFIVFSWPLRIWTVLCLCFLCGSDFRVQPDA
jgi:hypothetical protein